MFLLLCQWNESLLGLWKGQPLADLHNGIGGVVKRTVYQILSSGKLVV